MKKLEVVNVLGRRSSLGAMAVAMMITGAAGAASAADYKVSISSMAFGQTPSGLKVGDTITWTNNDTVPHTVTARDHSFDLHVNAGRSAKMTLNKTGNIPFYCIYHSSMRGALSVSDK